MNDGEHLSSLSWSRELILRVFSRIPYDIYILLTTLSILAFAKNLAFMFLPYVIIQVAMITVTVNISKRLHYKLSTFLFPNDSWQRKTRTITVQYHTRIPTMVRA